MRGHERVDPLEHTCEPLAIACLDADEITGLSFDRAVVEEHGPDERPASQQALDRRVQLLLLDVRMGDDAPHQVRREQADLVDAPVLELRE